MADRQARNETDVQQIQELSKREMEAVEGGLRFSRVVAPEDSDIDIPFSGFSQNGPESYTY